MTSPLVRIGRATPAVLFLAALSVGTSTDAFAQPSGSHMCGDGTNQTYFVDLPGVDESPGGGVVFPLTSLDDDGLTLPRGCDIYLLIISDMGRNRDFNELLFYPLAKFVAEHNGYVHYAWWNNLLQPYMSGPLHPIIRNDFGLEIDTPAHHPGKRFSQIASFAAPILGFGESGEYEVLTSECAFKNPSALPVIGGILNVAGSAGCSALTTVTNAFFSPVLRRPFPDSTLQMVGDVQHFIRQTDEQNPNALIIVAGHGLGAHVAAQASMPMAGDSVLNRIDLLALIDPFAARRGKDGTEAPDSEFASLLTGGLGADATREFSRRYIAGYARRDCHRVGPPGSPCKLVTLIPPKFDCFTRNELLPDPPPVFGSFAPIACSGYVTIYKDRQIYAKHVYHRWQNETGFPADFSAGQAYKFVRPGGIRPFEKMSLYPTTLSGPHFAGHMCGDPTRTDSTGLPCSPHDGHDELAGFRATRSAPASFLTFSLAVNLRVPLGLAAKNWPSPSDDHGRFQAMLEMTAPDPDNNWEHRPASPELCLVCDDLVALARDLHEENNPPESEDDTAPVTTASVDPVPNPEGWNAADVVVDLVSSDAGSGVREIEYSVEGAEASGPTITPGAAASRTLTAEGTTTLTFRARDEDGNEEAPVALQVHIDRTPPSITPHTETLPNINGWYQSAVVVGYTASDALSGVLPGSETKTISDEGRELEIIVSVEDKAGNTASVPLLLNIDLTPPEITLDRRTPAANAAGWNNSPVTIIWTCTDALSGPVAAVDSVTVGSDGEAQSATGTCRDAADHVTNDSVEGIYIDTAPPSVDAVSNVAPNSNGWHNTDVVVRFEASDLLSKIAVSSPDAIVTTEGIGQLVSGEATDKAGNTAGASIALNIDKTAPAITLFSRTPANGAGWNNSDVTLVWNCSDELSGPVLDPISHSLSTEGASQTATGTCADKAGHTTSNTQAGIKIDKTSPTSHITTPANGAVYLLNGIVHAAYGCVDALSGVSACVGPVASGEALDTATVGDKTFTVSAADVAGNQGGASHSYSVQYAFSGFANPIAAMPAMNTAKAGRTVPVKYSLGDVNGASIADLTSFVSLISAPVACDANVATAAAEETDAAGSTAIRFESGQFIYNWKTQSAWQGTCRALQLTLNDGTRHMVAFQFK